MLIIAKKPKNLNRDSQRAYWEKQRDYAISQLEAVPELYKSDFEELIESYEKSLIEHEFAPGTKKIYLRNAKWFINNFSGEEEPVTKEDVIDCKLFLQDKYEAVQTINSYITSINRFLFYCDIGDFKVSKVKGQGDNTLPYRIYEKEYKRMWMRAKQLGMMNIYLAIKIMGETGVRVNELKSFTGNSIKSNFVTVDNKGKVRRVPVPQDLRYELRDYAKNQGITDGPIITATYDQLRNGLKDIAGLCKVEKKKVTPHAFRHYFGFKFVDRKGDLKLAQLSDIMGHSSVETTRIYTRGTLEDYLKTMEEIK